MGLFSEYSTKSAEIASANSPLQKKKDENHNIVFSCLLLTQVLPELF